MRHLELRSDRPGRFLRVELLYFVVLARRIRSWCSLLRRCFSLSLHSVVKWFEVLLRGIRGRRTNLLPDMQLRSKPQGNEENPLLPSRCFSWPEGMTSSTYTTAPDQEEAKAGTTSALASLKPSVGTVAGFALLGIGYVLGVGSSAVAIERRPPLPALYAFERAPPGINFCNLKKPVGPAWQNFPCVRARTVDRLRPDATLTTPASAPSRSPVAFRTT